MLTVIHDEKNHEFIMNIEGKMAALKYHVLPGRTVWDFYSTFVPVEFRGRDIGRNLVKYGLDFAQKNHHQIIASCPFVRHFIDENPDYEKMVYVDVI